MKIMMKGDKSIISQFIFYVELEGQMFLFIQCKIEDKVSGEKIIFIGCYDVMCYQ